MLLNVTPYQDLHGTQPDLLHYVLFLHLLALPKLGGMFCTRCEYVSGHHQAIAAPFRRIHNTDHTPVHTRSM